jgi:hypothetical protein
MEGNGREDVVARLGQTLDRDKIDKAPLRAAARQDSDDIDGFCDHRTRYSEDRFLDELLKPAKRAERRASMDGADTARMAGAPGFQEVQGFGAADLADGNAVWSKAK